MYLSFSNLFNKQSRTDAVYWSFCLVWCLFLIGNYFSAAEIRTSGWNSLINCLSNWLPLINTEHHTVCKKHWFSGLPKNLVDLSLSVLGNVADSRIVTKTCDKIILRLVNTEWLSTILLQSFLVNDIRGGTSVKWTI